MYPDPRVESVIAKNFIPVKIHIKENPDGFKRFGAQWTPTVIVADPDGTERHRFEGFLPAEEFNPQLLMGLAKADFANGRFKEAEQHYRELVEKSPNAEIAPEALYWAGVSRYKGSGDASALKDTATAFQSRYKDTAWAKRSSVWAA